MPQYLSANMHVSTNAQNSGFINQEQSQEALEQFSHQLVNLLSCRNGFVDFIVSAYHGDSYAPADLQAWAGSILGYYSNCATKLMPRGADQIVVEIPAYDYACLLLQSVARGQLTNADQIIGQFEQFAEVFDETVNSPELISARQQANGSSPTIGGVDGGGGGNTEPNTPEIINGKSPGSITPPVNWQPMSAGGDFQVNYDASAFTAIYSSINANGGSVNMFIDILNGVVTDPQYIKDRAAGAYSILNSLANGTDADQIPGFITYMSLLQSISNGSISNASQLAQALDVTLSSVTTLVDPTKGLQQALDEFEGNTEWSTLRGGLKVYATESVFPQILSTIDEKTTFAELKSNAESLATEFRTFISQNTEQPLTQVEAHVPGVTQLLDLLDGIGNGTYPTLDDVVNKCGDYADPFRSINSNYAALVESVNNYSRRHGSETMDNQIKVLVNANRGAIAFFHAILWSEITDEALIRSECLNIHKALIADITALTNEPIDAVKDRIVGLKEVFSILYGVIAGTYVTSTQVGDALVVVSTNIIHISDRAWEMQSAYSAYLTRANYEQLVWKIGSRISEPGGALEYFETVTNALYTQATPSDIDVTKLKTLLTNYIASLTDLTLKQVEAQVPGLTEVYATLDGLAGSGLTDDQILRLMVPIPPALGQKMEVGVSQPLANAIAAATTRQQQNVLQAETTALIHQPGGALDLFESILYGKQTLAGSANESDAILNELKTLQELAKGYRHAEPEYLIEFIEKLSNGQFTSDDHFSNQFGSLLYQIEAANPTNQGAEALRFCNIRRAIRAKWMSKGAQYGAYIYFACVLEERLTSQENIKNQATRVRKQLLQEVSSVTNYSIDEVRAQISGLGETLDALSTIEVDPNANGLLVANLVNNIMPTLAPLSTANDLDLLQQWVVYYLKNHQSSVQNLFIDSSRWGYVEHVSSHDHTSSTTAKSSTTTNSKKDTPAPASAPAKRPSIGSTASVKFRDDTKPPAKTVPKPDTTDTTDITNTINLTSFTDTTGTKPDSVGQANEPTVTEPKDADTKSVGAEYNGENRPKFNLE